MLPKLAEAQRLLTSLEDLKILPPGAAVGKVNVDEEGQLRLDHNITMFPTLLVKSKRSKLEGAMLPFLGNSDTGAQIASHLATTAVDVAHLQSSGDAKTFTRMLEHVSGFLAGSETPTLMLVMQNDEEHSEAAKTLQLLVGRSTFLAVSSNPSHGRDAMRAVKAWNAKDRGMPKAPKSGTLYVMSEANGVLARSLTGPGAEGEKLLAWAMSAAWPTVSKFDGSAAQGDRIRHSPIESLMLLVADESDFMFGAFKESLENVAMQHRGQAHFLYADEGDKRIQGIVSGAGVRSFPAVVFMSLTGDHEPRSLEGSQITEEALIGMLSGGAAKASGGGDEL